MNWMLSTLVWQLVLTIVFAVIIYAIWRVMHPGKKW